MSFATIKEAVEDIRQGRMVIVVDDEDRENEGDLTVAAEAITPEIINFMATHGRGLICLPMTRERLDELEVPLMVDDNSSTFNTAFCVSIEGKKDVSTGISASDRSATVRAAIDPETGPEDLAKPGHMFPLRAEDGGVLRRAGQTEAAVDLARMAGLYPAGVICEIMNEDGTMARVPQLQKFAAEHDLKVINIADLIRYRLRTERFVNRVASPQLPTRYGDFTLYAYENEFDSKTHVALVMGEVTGDEPVLIRVHSECLTGDAFFSQRCDCGPQLETAMQRIADDGRGVIVYLRQEGRGIGLVHKLRAYELQDKGADTVEANEALGFEADQRDYGIGAQILTDLGVSRLRIMTNNPRKFVGLSGYGLEIVERVPIEVEVTEATRRYLETKKNKLGHDLSSV
jgi:3,4-dihydroxy 2-butanone 4-phosphate synthase/GTP cyclohydrolase II